MNTILWVLRIPFALALILIGAAITFISIGLLHLPFIAAGLASIVYGIKSLEKP